MKIEIFKSLKQHKTYEFIPKCKSTKQEIEF